MLNPDEVKQARTVTDICVIQRTLQDLSDGSLRRYVLGTQESLQYGMLNDGSEFFLLILTPPTNSSGT